MNRPVLRSLTRQEVTDPERLHKALLEMQALIGSLYERNRELEQLQRERERELTERVADGRSLISGIANPADALVKLGIDQSATRLSDYAAAVAPGVSEDITRGYNVGSEIITTSGDVYRCVGADPGNAQWKKLSP